MKLYQKLLLGFACVALLVSCVGFVAQQVNRNIQQSVHQLSETAARELHGASDLLAALRESAEAAHRLSSRPSEAERATAADALALAYERFDGAMAIARSASAAAHRHAATVDRLDLLERQSQKLIWLADASAAFNAYREYAELGFGPDHLEQAAAEVARPLTRYRDAAAAGLAIDAAAVQGELRRADRLLFGAVLLGIGMTLVLGILISNSIAGPLVELAEATRTIGRGRLNHRVNLRSHDEVSELGDALNRMAEELSQTTVSKRFLEHIISTMTDPLFVLTPEGRIDMVNDAALRMLGYHTRALQGQLLGMVLAEGEKDTREIVEQAHRWGHTAYLEMGLLRREGAVVPVVLSGALMQDADGTPQGIVCVAKDITQQKLVEAELVSARQHAEEMARMKSNFLANMSHEIRTPLTGIIGSAQVLHEMTHGEPLEMAAVIERAGIRLLGTINSVLDMARIEAGELKPTVEPVALAEEARDAASVLRRLAEVKSIDLRVVERTPGVWAHADPGFLHRIVTNLVGNAIKFTEAGAVTVEVDAADESAVLRVIDTGIGIGPDFLPYLFEEFRQESVGIERSHEGTGLGLAITKRLVDLLGGTISVASEQGVGTTFTVVLPRVEVQRRPIRFTTAQVAA
jgi:PAS domain S-box-containing protein